MNSLCKEGKRKTHQKRKGRKGAGEKMDEGRNRVTTRGNYHRGPSREREGANKMQEGGTPSM